MADDGQLQQALIALLVNAVEAMKGLPGGEGQLSVRLRGTADEVEIDVADTGVGIPPEVLPQIFEPFFSTKEAENGVGLGLSVVYGIVQRHGGRIEVESQVGRGTVFHVRLPRNATLRRTAGRRRRRPARVDRMTPREANLREGDEGTMATTSGQYPDRGRRVLRPRLAVPLVPQGRLRGPGGGERRGRR